MIDQARVAVELLHQMIVGDHPIDLRLTHLCTGKIGLGAQLAASCGAQTEVVEQIEMLDQAQIFNAPGRFVQKLRGDAIRALHKIVPSSLEAARGKYTMVKLPLAVGIADAVIEAERREAIFDHGAAADALLKAHPNSGATREEVVEILTQEVGEDKASEPRSPAAIAPSM